MESQQNTANPERTLGVIDNAQFPAVEDKPVYSLVFTSERVIAVLLAAEAESVLKIAAIDGLKKPTNKKLRLKNIVNRVKDASENLASSDPVSILGTYRGSFAVPYSRIRRIKLRNGFLPAKPYIKIYSYDNTYSFRLLNNFGRSLARNVFSSYKEVLESTGLTQVY